VQGTAHVFPNASKRLWRGPDLLHLGLRRIQVLAPRHHLHAERPADLGHPPPLPAEADDAQPPRLPKGRVPEALAATVRTWGELDQLEKDNELSFLREPDLGFAWAAYRWARGARLESVLDESPDLEPRAPPPLDEVGGEKVARLRSGIQANGRDRPSARCARRRPVSQHQ